MPTPALSLDEIRSLLAPFTDEVHVPEILYTQLSSYLDLLLRWNGRTNLTAIRDPREIVTRHFGESLFAAYKLRSVAPDAQSTLDFGSGAGFPGIPLQLALPEMRVTLAESQGKKAAFLREAIRVLKLPTTLWARRAEEMTPSQTFDLVTLRAVDKMDDALVGARERLTAEGKLLVLGGSALADTLSVTYKESIPQSAHRFLLFC